MKSLITSSWLVAIFLTLLACSKDRGPLYGHQEKVTPQDYENARQLGAALIENSIAISPFKKDLPDSFSWNPLDFECQLLPTGNMLLSFSEGEWNYGHRYELLLEPQGSSWDLRAMASQGYSDVGVLRVEGHPVPPIWRESLKIHFAWVDAPGQSHPQLLFQFYTTLSLFKKDQKKSYVGSIDSHPEMIPSVHLKRKLEWATSR